jgi:predicted Zn finger-like uncharacterized protein
VYTQCPECGTVFRVTAQVLRAAQGQVRCGVCDVNFDALRFLTDDIELEVNAASASRIVGAPLETRPSPEAAQPQTEPPPPSPPPPPPPDPRPSPSPQPPSQPPPSRPPPPTEMRAPREFGAATRNRPSADEERELGEIAATLARGAQPRTGAVREPPAPPPPAAAEASEINILEPGDVDDFILDDDDGEDIPDAALEFDLPAERWEQVFVLDPGAPLDLELADAAPAKDDAPMEAAEELVLLEEPVDHLARTDEYRTPDFGAEIELEPADAAERAAGEVTELEPAEVGELSLAPTGDVPIPAAEPVPVTEPVAVPRRRRAAPDWKPVPVDELAATPASSRVLGGARGRGPRAALRRAAVPAAAAVLGLGLLAQVVHFYRDSLAEVPIVGPALGALYAGFGVPLEPRWNLAVYEVRQWGAQSEEAAGVLRLRASIVNRAAHPQPFPLLRVTLEDRFGSQVGRREFTPAEYLPGRAAPRELLGTGARADADLRLADPGNQAVGFELDVCLERHRVLICGADAKAGGG